MAILHFARPFNYEKNIGSHVFYASEGQRRIRCIVAYEHLDDTFGKHDYATFQLHRGRIELGLQKAYDLGRTSSPVSGPELVWDPQL